MENNTRKYILIPEYKPLWAMRKCFGPTHGPLTEPCPTTLDIIGQLLRQDGKDKLTVMEVLNPKTDPGSTPVELTLDNYTLPYDQILRGVKIEKTTATPITKNSQPVKPTVSESDKAAAASIRNMINGTAPEPPAEPEVEKTPAPAVEEPVAEEHEPASLEDEVHVEAGEPIAEEQVQQEETAETADDTVVLNGGLTVGDPEPETPAETVVSDPYAGMTKKQRREARKAAEAAAAAAASGENASETTDE